MVTVLVILLCGTCLAAGTEIWQSHLSTNYNHLTCVLKIMHRYFSYTKTLVLAIPDNGLTDNRKSLQPLGDQIDVTQLVKLMLKKMSENSLWSTLVFQQYSEIEVLDTFFVYDYCNYVIFVWPHDEEDIYQVLEDQLNTFKALTSWNPRGKFIVLVINHAEESPQVLAKNILQMLWVLSKVVNVIVLVAQVYSSSPHNGVQDVLEKTTPTSDLYTYFPYRDERCGEVTDVVLIDFCFGEHSAFHRNADLFPEKIPTDFKGCSIKVGTVGFDPYVTVVENYTLEDHTRVYKVGGLLIDKVVISIERMNIEIKFLPPTQDLNADEYLRELSYISEGYSDITIGIIGSIPMMLLPDFEPTIQYEFTEMNWLVPCPSHSTRVEKVMSLFTMSVWLLIICVKVVVTLVFSSSVYTLKDSSANRMILCRSFYDVWAIFMSVSIPKMPESTNRRMLFFIYVCYSFAISIIFQAYFVTFLVEPGYEKNLETFDELLSSNLKYGYIDSIEMAISTSDYRDHTKFPESRRVDCSDVTNCMKRVMLDRDIATIAAPIAAHYTASTLGVNDDNKAVCFLKGRLALLYCPKAVLCSHI
ncbi:hypothetical protein ANN_19807 [Periplaneta americana]|uniref:Uncharacterized protein n=1 Tax=Periplaneta americana TaxID=6978 RepID=A0ABQ8SBK1_PERAM|nr:hypothetical protein ANN_19807 [Periplaneta americana]